MLKIKFIPGFILFLLFCLAAKGCLFNQTLHNSSPSSLFSGSYLEQIETGVTTKDWVIETLGTPAEIIIIDDDSEILKYKRHEKKHHQTFAVLLIFSSTTYKDIEETLSFEIQNGIVHKYWLD